LRFVGLGFEHILPLGLDHVAFVAGLALRAPDSLRRLVLSLSLFTVAHTLALACGTLDLLRLPAALVEPLIGLSICAVGLDNLRRRDRSPGERPRNALIFGFGLVHGLGFAGALRELSLSPEALLVGLAGFNVGVELGQLLVVGVLVGLLSVARRVSSPDRLRRIVTFPASIAIVVVGAYFVSERLLGMALH
jgi:hypothetical protein